MSQFHCFFSFDDKHEANLDEDNILIFDWQLTIRPTQTKPVQTPHVHENDSGSNGKLLSSFFFCFSPHMERYYVVLCSSFLSPFFYSCAFFSSQRAKSVVWTAGVCIKSWRLNRCLLRCFSFQKPEEASYLAIKSFQRPKSKKVAALQCGASDTLDTNDIVSWKTCRLCTTMSFVQRWIVKVHLQME